MFVAFRNLTGMESEETQILELVFQYKFHPLHITTVWHRQKPHSSKNIDCNKLYN